MNCTKQDKDYTLLRTRCLTPEEEILISKASKKADGSIIPRPVFYHDAIIEKARRDING